MKLFGWNQTFCALLILSFGLIQTACQFDSRWAVVESTRPIQAQPLSTELLTSTASPVKTLMPTETPSNSVLSADGFLLYGASILDNENQIYALRPGGASQLVTEGQLLSGQAYSPDGGSILVDTNDWSNPPLSPEKVFIFNLATGQKTPLSLLAHPRNGVFWSLDGAKLLYIARFGDDATDQLVLYDIASGENKMLVQTDNILLTAGWAVDGKTIAYVAEIDGQYDLFSVNEETLKIHRLSNTIEIETMVLWSPTALQLLIGTVSGEQSAFEMWPWGVSKIMLHDLNSGNELLLVEKWFGSESIAWSADGGQIVFSDTGLLCIKNLETMVETCPLAGVAPYDGYFASFWEPPVWIVGSHWLAFKAFTGTCDELFFLNLEDNSVTLGDLSCEEITGSPLAPIYWLPSFDTN